MRNFARKRIANFRNQRIINKTKDGSADREIERDGATASTANAQNRNFNNAINYRAEWRTAKIQIKSDLHKIPCHRHRRTSGGSCCARVNRRDDFPSTVATASPGTMSEAGENKLLFIHFHLCFCGSLARAFDSVRLRSRQTQAARAMRAQKCETHSRRASRAAAARTRDSCDCSQFMKTLMACVLCRTVIS